MSRAACYLRISRDREGAGLGVQRQESDCRELAARHGLAVTEVYTDNDMSAYSGKPRPQYRRLLDDITAGRVDAVLAWHTDRLHRSPTELEQYITVCEARGVPTFTVKAGPLDLATPSGRMVARQLGAVARYEVEHQIERQQRAKLQAATDGRWGGGRRPYGFEPDGVTVRADEAVMIQEATDAILSGRSLRSLVAAMNARGAVTSTGRPWKPSELRKVMLRARNAGLREHRGQIVGPAGWPALVTEDKWRAVVSILTDSGRRTSWTAARRWMLTGVARCGVCGGTLMMMQLHNTRGGVPSYTCRTGKHVVRNAAELDDLISQLVVARLSRPDAAGLLDRPESGVDVAALRTGAAALRQRMDDLAAMYADGDIDARQLREGTERLRTRLESVESAMAAANRGSVLSGVVDAPDVAAAWQAAHVDVKAAVIDELMTVTVHRTRKGRPPGWRPGESYFDPRSVEITWRTG